MSSRPKLMWPVIIGIIVIVAAIAILGLSTNLFSLGSGSSQPTTTEVNCNSLPTTGIAPGNVTANPNATVVNVLVIETDPGNIYEGMNGSAFHVSVPWPVINVHQGQKVVIHVINCASSEPHGFAITHYFDSGVSLSSGQSYTLTFTANEKGTFRMFCNIFCSIHPLMQNGALVVS